MNKSPWIQFNFRLLFPLRGLRRQRGFVCATITYRCTDCALSPPGSWFPRFDLVYGYFVGILSAQNFSNTCTEKPIIIPPPSKRYPYQTSNVRGKQDLRFANKYLSPSSIPPIIPAEFGHRGGGIMIGFSVLIKDVRLIREYREP